MSWDFDQYTAEIVALENASALSAQGSCDAVIYYGKTRLGKVTLIRDDVTGWYRTHGGSFDYWADDDLQYWLTEQFRGEDPYLQQAAIDCIEDAVNRADRCPPAAP